MPFPREGIHATTDSLPTQIGTISQQLHQTAQPLALLQGWLELALLKPHSVDEYKGIIERAIDQSRRLSGCFDRVREMVRVQESESHSAHGIERSHV